jgi:hypothetical protein
VSHAVRRLKRWVILIHLYLGVALCVLGVMWFATGVVLMYAPFPGFVAERQYARASPLDCSRCDVRLPDATARMRDRDTVATIRLGMMLDRPGYRFLGADRRWHLVFADDASSPAAIGPDVARRVAAGYVALDTAMAAATTLIDEPDQWTVEGVLRDQLPLYRVEFRDSLRTRVYVSAAGGEAITTSTRRERALAWVGAIPHWLYPRVLRARLAAWRWTIIILAGLGAFMSLAGLAIGIWQFRWSRRNDRAGRPTALSPYRTRWMRWHHYLGLAFGVVTFSWFLSGMLSIDPLDWSPGDSATNAERLALAGGTIDASAFGQSPAEVTLRFAPAGSLRELRAAMVGGKAFWVGIDGAAHARLVSAGTGVPDEPGELPFRALSLAAARLVPGARAVAFDTLRAHDDYYYPSPEHARPLPVLRVRFDDRERSAFYLDPRLGSIAMKAGNRSRLERWLYTGLHDFDFQALTSRRPLWDVVVILFSLGGLALAVTGVVVAWRWIGHQLGVPVGPRR